MLAAAARAHSRARALPLPGTLAPRHLAAATAAGSANLDWPALGFQPHATAGIVRYEWSDGAWDAGVEVADPTVKVHVFSHCLNFGQTIFEGLKAFHTADGRVCAFNPKANADRMARGAARMCMPHLPKPLFLEAVERVVRLNAAFVPPYGSGGSLYIRPILFGHGPSMAIAPAPRFTLAVAATPVSRFFGAGEGLRPVRALVRTDYDRAAPRGTGGYKVAGNYGPDMLVGQGTASRGFDVSLFLDAATQSFVEEFSVANFVAVAADGALVTPSSPSVLPSCTRKVVMTLAQDMGMRTEERPIPWAEVASLREAAACGTAVVLTPMKEICRGAEIKRFEGHATVQRLYDRVVAVQLGEAEDAHGLLHEVAL